MTTSALSQSCLVSSDKHQQVNSVSRRSRGDESLKEGKTTDTASCFKEYKVVAINDVQGGMFAQYLLLMPPRFD